MLGFSLVVPIKFFHVHVIWPCSFSSRNLCYRNAHTNKQSSTDCNVKNQQFKYMSVGIWLNKLWSVHNMQYCATIIKNEVDHDSCQYRLPWHQRMKKACESLWVVNVYKWYIQKISLEGYILKILASCFWALGWGNDRGMSKEKEFFLIICYFYNFKKCKLISFLCRHIGQRPL